MADLTMFDIALRQGRDEVAGLIDQIGLQAPEMRQFPIRLIRYTSYKTLLRTDVPRGSFVKVGQGALRGKSEYANKLVECFPYENPLRVQKLLAEADERGEDAVLADEMEGAILGAGLSIGSQVWGGRDNDALGFPGAAAVVDSDMIVDATGTGAGSCTRIWGVIYGEKYCQLVGGNNKGLEPIDWALQQVEDSVTKRTTHSWCGGLNAWIGCQLVNKFALGCVANINAGKPADDDMIAELEAKLPAGLRFNAYYMAPTTLEMIRKSRTATNPTGAQAPLPTTLGSYNTPVVLTDSISKTENPI